ncbi:MAG: LysR family transcriptional regulator [Verrucomicrobiota bacterium]
MFLFPFKAFTALSKNLHYRITAEELRIIQPALSRRIKELEEILGFLLFERSI